VIPANEITWAPAPAPVITANTNVNVTATWQGITSAEKVIAVTKQLRELSYDEFKWASYATETLLQGYSAMPAVRDVIIPDGLSVSYRSGDPTVLTVNETTGAITELKKAGYVSMFVEFAGNDEYAAADRSYPIYVYGLDRIELSDAATKTAYETGDAFEHAGLVATAVYTLGSETPQEQVVTDLATWTPDPATIAANTTQVSVTAAWNGKTSAAEEVAVTVKTHKVIFDAEKNHVLLGVKNGLENISSGDAFAKGTVLTVEVELESADYVLATLTANTTDIKATKQFTIGEVDVTIEATSELKPVAPISWSATSATIAKNGDVTTLPTLTNTQGLDVMYESNNTDVATINAESGAITVKAAGETTIRAIYVATPESQYRTTFAEYTLTVTAATYAVTFAEAENGSFEILNGTTPVVSGNEFTEGTELTISTTPATGYVLKDITILDGDEDDVTDKVLEGNVITVNDYAIKVIVTFKVEGGGTALDNAEADEQAEKIMLNNQLFILRGGKMYDAQGKLVK
jgi:hypothetical protein